MVVGTLEVETMEVDTIEIKYNRCRQLLNKDYESENKVCFILNFYNLQFYYKDMIDLEKEIGWLNTHVFDQNPKLQKCVTER